MGAQAQQPGSDHDKQLSLTAHDMANARIAPEPGVTGTNSTTSRQLNLSRSTVQAFYHLKAVVP